MKNIILSLLLLNASFSYLQETDRSITEQPAFDENFGFTNKVLDHGNYKGMLFQDAKKKYLEKVKEDWSKSKQGDWDTLFEYCYNINPNAPESQQFKRYMSIDATRNVLYGTHCFTRSEFSDCPCKSEKSHVTKKEAFYIITGKNIEHDKEALNKPDYEIFSWAHNAIEDFFLALLKAKVKIIK